MLAGVVQQTDSGIVEVVAIVLALVAVIAITGFFSWREEQEFLYDREQTQKDASRTIKEIKR